MAGTENNSERYFTLTYGCQMNVFDTEVLSGHLEGMGFIPAESEEEADVLVINTCAVRKKAEDKVLSKLGKLKLLKEQKPTMTIVLWGCMAQQENIAKRVRERYGFVDLIGGTHSLGRFPELLEKARVSRRVVVDIDTVGEREDLPIRRGHSFKAWIPISYGCNNYCTYCIVPFVRGPEKSRTPQSILEEVKVLAGDGYKEITLLGQNVNSYGKDLKEEVDFADLLKLLESVNGLVHIRYMTSHPRDFNEKIIRTIQEGEKICEHFHLPIQSGSDKILKLMNRGYTREYYLELIHNIKGIMDNFSITSDIIVGFPGEEEKDFEDTVQLMKEVEFDAAYTFIYSPREGTEALKLDGQIDPDEKKKRILTLNEMQGKISLKKNRQLLGTEQEVLVEGRSKTNPERYTGRTRTNKIVHFFSNEDLLGMLIKVKIIEAKSWTLTGEYK